MERSKSLQERMSQFDQFIRGLDPAVRSIAFERLLSAADGDDDHEADRLNGPPKLGEPRNENGDDCDRSGFFAKNNHDKPSENVQLIAAWIFSQFGTSPITGAEIRRVAAEVGIIVPERPDKTMEGAASDGKILFQKTDQGYRPTVHAQILFKKRYNVTPGNKQRVAAKS